MANDHWPLFDLEVRTPRLTLRYLDDELAAQLVAVAAHGIHDPATMPFSIPWTDLPSPEMEREAMRFYWTSRAGTRPESWRLQFAVVVDGTVIGACRPLRVRLPDAPAVRDGVVARARVPGPRVRQGDAAGRAHAGVRRPRCRHRHDRAVARQRGIARGDAITGLRGGGPPTGTSARCPRRVDRLPDVPLTLGHPSPRRHHAARGGRRAGLPRGRPV